MCRTDLESPGDRRYWLVSCPLDKGSLTGCNEYIFSLSAWIKFLNIYYPEGKVRLSVFN